jgi:hypothetical protein
MGMQRGFPDLLIMDVPPSLPDKKGAAIEMKTRSPGAKVSPDQEKWLARLEARGWVCRVCWGADEAIAWLQSLGYGRATRGGRRNGRYTD